MTRRLHHLENLFPNLASVGYVPKSEQTSVYNCIAWSAEDATRNWQGSYVDGYWPPGAIEGYDIAALVSAFEQLNFVICQNGDREDDHVKVAIYADRVGKWTHAARQLPDGRWTSKIGELEDIIHKTPFALTGSDYGNVVHYMKRPVATPPPQPPLLPTILKLPTPRGRKRRK
jgi:hypothetical protein